MKLQTKFQDEDFEKGEVVEANIFYGGDGRFKLVACALKGGQHDFYYRSLKELNEEWEDYEKPKEYYWIDYDGKIKCFEDLYEWQDKMKQIGNYFETEEEAERAVEKLKAWKRLKDAGFKINSYGDDSIEYEIKHRYDNCIYDLELLLFGGEE